MYTIYYIFIISTTRMKNLVFVCVFCQEKYLDLLFMLLESMFLYGNLQDNTDILIYTSSVFADTIRQHRLFCDKIKLYTNDTYTTIHEACFARLDLFTIPIVKDYDTLLYLDTDVLIKRDLTPVFDLVSEDKLYAMEEGNIEWQAGWGWQKFQYELDKYEDKTAFNSGVLLFKNSETMKQLFADINQHRVDEPTVFQFMDQPYIVYNTMTRGLHNNKTLKEYVLLNDINWDYNPYHIHSDKTIVHFIGTPGNGNGKYERMAGFMCEMSMQ